MGNTKRTTDRTHPQASNAPPDLAAARHGEIREAGGAAQGDSGRTVIELAYLGWRPETHGELKNAEKAGVIVWVRKKWFAV